MEDRTDKVDVKKIWYDTIEMLLEPVFSHAGYFANVFNAMGKKKKKRLPLFILIFHVLKCE